MEVYDENEYGFSSGEVQESEDFEDGIVYSGKHNGINMISDEVVEEEEIYMEEIGTSDAGGDVEINSTKAETYELPYSLHHHGYARAPTWAIVTKTKEDGSGDSHEKLSSYDEHENDNEDFNNSIDNNIVNSQTDLQESSKIMSSAAQLAPTLYSHLTGHSVINDNVASETVVETEVVPHSDMHVYDDMNVDDINSLTSQVVVNSSEIGSEQPVSTTVESSSLSEMSVMQQLISNQKLTVLKSGGQVTMRVPQVITRQQTQQLQIRPKQLASQDVSSTKLLGSSLPTSVSQKSYVQIQPAQGKGSTVLSTGQTLPVSLLLKLQQQGIQVTGLPSGTLQVTAKKEDGNDPVCNIISDINNDSLIFNF